MPKNNMDTIFNTLDNIARKKELTRSDEKEIRRQLSSLLTEMANTSDKTLKTEYLDKYNKLKEKIDYDKKQADAAHGQGGYAQGTYSQGEGAPDYDTQQQQMGGGFCEQCATCCACNMLFNCCMNACCGCN